jgi:hypothetical protein
MNTIQSNRRYTNKIFTVVVSNLQHSRNDLPPTISSLHTSPPLGSQSPEMSEPTTMSDHIPSNRTENDVQINNCESEFNHGDFDDLLETFYANPDLIFD